MLIISEALEAEGYGPSQATIDEVIRHLWWKKERVYRELKIAKKTLQKTLGNEKYQIVKVSDELLSHMYMYKRTCIYM